jgi:hypothetical protein
VLAEAAIQHCPGDLLSWQERLWGVAQSQISFSVADMQPFQPQEVIVERGSEASPIYRNLRNALPLIPFRTVDAVPAENGNPDFSALTFSAAKKRLFLTRQKGEFLKKCPGSDGQVCCNYFVINFASNCPMDCSYCYLQEYLADNPELKVFSNVGFVERGRRAEQAPPILFPDRHRGDHG